MEMSHVQLSSSALERLQARRTFPLHRRTSVCRNLFGPVDHEELNREMKTRMREISERDQQRWNFNFETNTPLEGDYEWEEVSVDKTPGFYQDAQERLSAPQQSSSESSDSGSSCASPAELNQENRPDKLNSGKHTTRRLSQCAKRKRAASADSNNTHITGKNRHGSARCAPSRGCAPGAFKLSPCVLVSVSYPKSCVLIFFLFFVYRLLRETEEGCREETQ